MKKQKISRRFDISQFELCRLHPHSVSDITALNRLLHSSMQYFLLHNGAPARLDAAQMMLSTVPAGKTEHDKFVMAFFDGPEIIAFVDILRHYPQNGIATIKLFLIAESHQGNRLGVGMLAQAKELAASWGCYDIQLGVCTSNVRGIKFWRREGFKEIRREPMPGFTGDAIIMQRNFRPIATARQSSNQQSCAQQAV